MDKMRAKVLAQAEIRRQMRIKARRRREMLIRLQAQKNVITYKQINRSHRDQSTTDRNTTLR
jgi:hypothetical protein